ncbi:efflux transporter periplasmic adaptor subunit [[Phormidium ambiguum] IAM M-71]|uniref:Efflux transporter periplasmic adaptor subunit n=1 Tax=[Phormidium ambiguum] IAM M-71 TaxID=454136 RepID=A0A1U7IPS8_9CYAN|nr:efflux RND transporter periplasmic adaptor subunit [Phormidium ambiguum]OKH39347.1 efflux transporter periplasmic adaptor subunit [Phormidium ambiguum IAM M-71]
MMRRANSSLLYAPLLSLLVLTTPTVVLAHAGHDGHEFEGGNEAAPSSEAIQVDTETAKRLSIKVEPVKRQMLDVSIKTTGQIETLPSKKVEVTTPISGAKVVELLVEPGAFVKAGQPVAVLAAPDLVELRVNSQEKQAEAQGDLQKAQADLKLAQENLAQQRQIAAAEIQQAITEVRIAKEKYQRDKELSNAGAIPRRTMLESEAHLRVGEAQLVKALSRREVLAAEAELKRSQTAVEVAQSRLRLSNTAYQTRLQQLGTRANEKGLVVVTARISGVVVDREATLGQAFEDAGGKLMTIADDSKVFATANIYEKDLDKVKLGQRAMARFASLPNRTFNGRITVIGSVVQGETRVLPVKIELENPSKELKPGMFAELEVFTDQTANPILAIPSSAVVDANNRKLVYVQNGNAFQGVEVTLGETSGDMVEVKTGLFAGDLLVTQRAPQLYAQSLRGGNAKAKTAKEEVHKEEDSASKNLEFNIKNIAPFWWIIPGVGAIAFAAFWLGRRTKPQLTSSSHAIVYSSNNEKGELSVLGKGESDRTL